MIFQATPGPSIPIIPPDFGLFLIILVAIVLLLVRRRNAQWSSNTKVLWCMENNTAVEFPAKEDLNGIYLDVQAPVTRQQTQTLQVESIPLSVTSLSSIKGGRLMLIPREHEPGFFDENGKSRHHDKKGRLIWDGILKPAETFENAVIEVPKGGGIKRLRLYHTLDGSGFTFNPVDAAKAMAGTDSHRVTAPRERQHAFQRAFGALAAYSTQSFRNMVMPMMVGLLLGMVVMGIVLPRLFGV